MGKGGREGMKGGGGGALGCPHVLRPPPPANNCLLAEGLLISKCSYAHIYIYMYMCIYICTYISVCVYIYMSIYIYMYMHLAFWSCLFGCC